VSLEVSDLEHESMDAIVLSLDDQLSPHDRHVGKPGEIPYPKFHRSSSWRIDDEFLSLCNVFRNGLNSFSIGSMTHLSESKTS
jgi:hypothetical protein